MKSNPNTKLIFFHPSLPKQAFSTSLATHRLWLLFFFTFFTLVFTVTLFDTTITFSSSSAVAKNSATSGSTDPLHSSVTKALLHYAASSNFTTTNKAMSSAELTSIATALLQSPKPNFLIFGLTHETLLWFALNQHGRTVFVDENKYFISKFEQTWSIMAHLTFLETAKTFFHNFLPILCSSSYPATSICQSQILRVARGNLGIFE